MSRLKIFDDEIIAKRVYTKIEIGSKSAYNFKNRSSNKTNRIFKKNTEVVVKITSGSKNLQAVCKHLDYISREGTVEVITSDFDTLKGKDELKFLKKIYENEGAPIPRFGQEKKEKRHTINMVFSMQDYTNATPEKMKKAVLMTLKKMYPDNFFAIAFHNDTDNPHCHVCLKVADKNGKRINPKKTDLMNLRLSFAKALNELGVEAKATIRSKNNEVSYKLEKNKEQTKMHYYQVLDYGEAKYKFSLDKNAEDSFYVKYRTKKGITTIWSKDLARVIKENKILKGEYAKFKIVGQETYQIKKKVKVNGKIVEVTKVAKKSVWDASVLGREKELKLLQSDEANNPKYTIKENNERDYTKQYRQRILQELSNKSTIRRDAAQERNSMRILSKQPMVHDQKGTQMPMHINALNQLQQGKRGRTNSSLRWTSTRNNEIERDG
ncbi:TPA: relaxase/mobilization nuclease domain-containing protein [Campylobacter jejuni]|nr:spore coat protein CotH [Campylobacter jejuni]HDZ4368601.1 relaxase/mobilization nuclease domain-containing protein [Campylobacter jejuni]HDZ4377018.1 relaxase/mobilization nuclease domain-containing protein [Campylobacter jejuni]HED4623076.1 relaxase/mobilization nuclease domain-containing protein [Campylobacter jejuni]